jgi:hypothetical protein
LRKLGLIAATLAASVGVAGVAGAVDVNQSIKIKTTGKKGTKAKPTVLKLSVTTFTSAKDPAVDGTYATKKAVIHFDKNLKFNNRKFPVCSLQTVASAPENCPAGSKVGSGYAKATIGAQQIKANPTIEAYNAAGGKINLKLIKAANEVDSSGVLVGTLKSDTGKYGSKLDVPIPPKLQNQLGLSITLTEFNTVISTKKYKGLGYVTSVGCKTSYKFGGDFTFSDNTSAKVTSTSKC